MKEPEIRLDQEKIAAFAEKVYKMAEEEFGVDEDGDVLVKIDILDKTRYWYSYRFPLPHRYLIETELESIDLMKRLSLQAQSASDYLAKELQLLSIEKYEEEAKIKLYDAIESMSEGLGIPVEISDTVTGSKPEGTRWHYSVPKDHPSRFLRYRAVSEKDLISRLKSFILNQVSQIQDEGYKIQRVRVVGSSMSHLFRVYGLVDSGENNDSSQ